MRAGELGVSLDHAASVLQQSATLLAERMQHKQGLELGDVRSKIGTVAVGVYTLERLIRRLVPEGDGVD